MYVKRVRFLLLGMYCLVGWGVRSPSGGRVTGVFMAERQSDPQEKNK